MTFVCARFSASNLAISSSWVVDAVLHQNDICESRE